MLIPPLQKRLGRGGGHRLNKKKIRTIRGRTCFEIMRPCVGVKMVPNERRHSLPSFTPVHPSRSATFVHPSRSSFNQQQPKIEDEDDDEDD
jgi:hypothetical protein